MVKIKGQPQLRHVRLGRTHSDFEFAGHGGRRTTGVRTNFCIQMNFVMRISFFQKSSNKKFQIFNWRFLKKWFSKLREFWILNRPKFQGYNSPLPTDLCYFWRCRHQKYTGHNIHNIRDAQYDGQRCSGPTRASWRVLCRDSGTGSAYLL